MRWFASSQSQKREGTSVKNTGGVDSNRNQCVMSLFVTGDKLSKFLILSFLNLECLPLCVSAVFHLHLQLLLSARSQTLRSWQHESPAGGGLVPLNPDLMLDLRRCCSERKPEDPLFKREQTQLENEAVQRSEGSTGTVMSLAAANEARK